MSDSIQELRYCVRQIRRSPGFFATATLMIALGLAATTQIFTLVDALLLRTLPVRNPANLVQIVEQQPKRPANTFFAYPFYRELARVSSTVTEVVGQIDSPRALEWNGRSERVYTMAVTEEFFRNLGVNPRLGRMVGNGDSHV